MGEGKLPARPPDRAGPTDTPLWELGLNNRDLLYGDVLEVRCGALIWRLAASPPAPVRAHSIRARGLRSRWARCWRRRVRRVRRVRRAGRQPHLPCPLIRTLPTRPPNTNLQKSQQYWENTTVRMFPHAVLGYVTPWCAAPQPDP